MSSSTTVTDDPSCALSIFTESTPSCRNGKKVRIKESTIGAFCDKS